MSAGHKCRYPRHPKSVGSEPKTCPVSVAHATAHTAGQWPRNRTAVQSGAKLAVKCSVEARSSASANLTADQGSAVMLKESSFERTALLGYEPNSSYSTEITFLGTGSSPTAALPRCLACHRERHVHTRREPTVVLACFRWCAEQGPPVTSNKSCPG